MQDYYGYEFNVSLEQKAKNNMQFERQIGSKEKSYEQQLKIAIKKRKTRLEQIKKFVDENHKKLESYLDFGFKIIDYMDKNYYGKCKRKKLVKEMSEGFKLELIFHILDPCCFIDGVEVSLDFPRDINKICGVVGDFDSSSKQQQIKKIRELLEFSSKYIDTTNIIKKMEI